MGIVLGPQQYGKAETRVVRIRRDDDWHEIRDLNVTTALRGDFSQAYLTGDQSKVLPTDSQKNTAFAYALEHGTGEIEDYALALARHFARDIEPVTAARVEVGEYAWDRISVGGSPHPHAFVRSGQEVRTTAVTVEGTGAGQRAWVVSGLTGLTVLKSAGSEFRGFLTDSYTTLPETDDRVLATSLTARWRYAAPAAPQADWLEAYDQVRRILLARFAELHSLALQQSLWEMGHAVLAARPDIAEIRLSAPNKHHYLADLEPFGLTNNNEVFYAGDRPYGLIQCTAIRDDGPPAGPAWDTSASFA